MRKNPDASINIKLMLKLNDKGFKVSAIKIFQQVSAHPLETNKKWKIPTKI